MNERTWAVARAIEIAILEHYQISPGLAAAIRSGQDQPTALGIALARAAEAAMDKHSGFLTAETAKSQNRAHDQRSEREKES